jgi:methylthioribulose 1-phosphate dehydratase / enolase-phosphatase E1
MAPAEFPTPGSPNSAADEIMKLEGGTLRSEGFFDEPGRGWSNGDLRPELFPMTRNGRMQLYSSQRRWVHLASGWSRIGTGKDGKEASELTSAISSSNRGVTIVEDSDSEARAVRSLIAQLCEQFYRFGWATGTGGGISIRVGGPAENRPWRVFVAPSGIQKEDMVGDDVFELNMDRTIVHPPKTPNLRQSACTPLWFVVYKHRPTTRAVIHTHSMAAQLATMLDRTESQKVLRITHLEMLKGVGHHGYDDVLEIPIIDNRPSEDLLAEQLEHVINAYPMSNAVLVRRHGLYCWGDSWEQAKTQCEAFDYLFQSAVEMSRLGLDPGAIPAHGTYRLDDDKTHDAKRQKVGFHGLGKVDNARDVASNSIPILPRDGKVILLDIEGCTTAISFVKDTLFPYVLSHLEEYLAHLDPVEYNSMAETLRDDLPEDEVDQIEDANDCAAIVRHMVKKDMKVASLKTMQGQMWRTGYVKGDIKGHVYPDFVPMMQWMQSHGVKIYIYSSGSVEAQKLLFGYSEQGDLCGGIAGHFDITTSGSKIEPSSYMKIARSIGVSPSQIVFCSDLEAELKAASQAGIGHTVMTVRPGNAPLTAHGRKEYPPAHSLLQLCGL